MQMKWPTVLSWACLVAGVLFYIAAISGLMFGNATPPGDVGVVSTSLVLVLFGGAGLLLLRAKAPAQDAH